MGISVIINTYNEAHLLKDCIKSLTGFADEIVVGDMMSNDGSAELAEALGCKVIKYPHKNIVEETIVRRLEETLNDWVLLFDPDMRLPIETAMRLKDIVINDEADVVTFYLKNKIFGKYIYHGHGSAGFFVKFFKKSVFFRGSEPKAKIHTMMNQALLTKTKRILKLSKKYRIEHIAYGHVFACLEQHLRYANIEAQERFEDGERFNLFLMIYEVTRKVFVDFFYRCAWLSGMRGIIYSMIAELMIVQIHLLLWEKTKNR
jgi:glycosyltransferase involved in cell wall biosynthesis